LSSITATPLPFPLVHTPLWEVWVMSYSAVVSDAPLDVATDPWVPPNTFGARLAMIRQARGWNVRQAAEHCKVPEQSWHNWEDGKSPRDLAAKAQEIAERVPCDYVWLLAGVERRKTRSENAGRHLEVVSSRAVPVKHKQQGSPMVSVVRDLVST
jgi:transcriptional regulator with XRE-family HTH domain